ncbi:MAG TPA: hypothetical protein VNX01_01095 [Bacteroidia bacterium]|jgi:hypothetical protein|nr:hypothetical protein [Bacteroidia bacterium]
MRIKRKPHKQRLTLLASRLKECRQDYPFIAGEYYHTDNKAPYIVTEAGISFMCFPVVYALLAEVFPDDWENIHEVGVIAYHNNLNLALEEAIIEYFGLKPNQLHHCFVPFLQKVEKYGGQELDYNSKPKHLGFNILSLLNTQYPKSFIRMVLVEKIFVTKKTSARL